jgi:hypothetical protein
MMMLTTKSMEELTRIKELLEVSGDELYTFIIF